MLIGLVSGGCKDNADPTDMEELSNFPYFVSEECLFMARLGG